MIDRFSPAGIGARLLGLVLPIATARKLALPGFVLACLLALGLAWGAWQAFDWFNDRDAVRKDREASNIEQLQDQLQADTVAADQRVEDVLVQREQEQAYAEAIESPRAGDSDDPRVRLACERLRRSGKDTSSLPSCGGR